MSIEAMKHYEAALLEAFPRGATGDVFYHWNKARQAIEQAEKQEPVELKCRLVKVHDALGAHIGDTDPYIPEDMTDDEVLEYEPVFWAAKEIADLIGDAPWSKYTTPPAAQRTWVGLTDEEVDKAWRSVDYTVPWEQHRIDIARAIETKLKEKNNG